MEWARVLWGFDFMIQSQSDEVWTQGREGRLITPLRQGAGRIREIDAIGDDRFG
jgi:hypothetical protein